MSESQEKIVAFDNRFHEFGIQEVLGTDCAISPFFVLNESENKIELSLTSAQFTEILSSLIVGSEWAYPDKSHQILWNFVKGLHCPPELEADGDCLQYPSYASFIAYEPQNPFNEANVTPSGYLKPPFSRWGEFETILPDWADEWLGGIVEWATGYQTNDIICDIGSLPILANWLDLLTQGLPRLEIRVNGEGVIELELLAIPLGGQAIISIDNPIDLGDIFASIIDPNLRIIELNRDILSIPPETDVTHIEEIPVQGLGAHIIYVQFVPVVDDASIPIRFGGGIRSVELCGFDEIVESDSIMDIRLNAECGIEVLQSGVWTEKISKSELVACLADEFVADIRSGDNDNEDLFSLLKLKNGVWTEIDNWQIFLEQGLFPYFQEFGTAIANIQQEQVIQNNGINNANTINSNQSTQISQIQVVNNNQTSQIISLQNSDITKTGQISDLYTQLSDLDTSQAQQDADIADLVLSVGQNSLLIQNHEGRITTLEQSLGQPTLEWTTVYSFREVGDYGWSGNPYVSGQGFQFGNGLPLILSKASINVFDSRVTMIEIEVSQSNALDDYFVYFPDLDNSSTARFSSGGFTNNWIKVPNYDAPYSPVLRIPNPPSATVYLRRLRVLGVGSFNPFN